MDIYFYLNSELIYKISAADKNARHLPRKEDVITLPVVPFTIYTVAHLAFNYIDERIEISVR